MKKSLLVFLTGLMVFVCVCANVHANSTRQDSVNHYLSLTESVEQTNLYKAEAYVSRALDFARKIQNDSIFAHILLKKAQVLRFRGKLTNALPLLDTIRIISQQQNNLSLFTRATLEKGIVLMVIGADQKAAKELYYVINHSEHIDDLLRAKAHSSLGMLQFAQDMNEMAKENLQKAINYFSQSPSPTNQSKAFHYKTILYQRSRDSEKTLFYSQKAIEINKKQNNLYDLIGDYNRVSATHTSLMNHTKSREYLQLAIKLSEKIGADQSTAYNCFELAVIYQKEGKPEQAIELFEKALKICTANSYLYLEKTVSRELSKLYYTKKNYKKSTEYVWQYNKAKDKLNNELYINNLKIAEQQFESEETAKKQEEYIQTAIYHSRIRTVILISIIIFLVSVLILLYLNLHNKQEWLRKFEKKNKIISQQAAALTISNQSKEKLLSVIAHDLINPFNTIIGLSDLLISKEADEKMEETFISKINYTSKEAYHLLNQLLTWSRLKSDNIVASKTDVNITQVAKQNYILYKPTAEAKNITLIENLEKEVTACTDQDLLSTIIRNLLSNAVKFTPEKGTVTISTGRRNSNTVEIIIADTGVGLSAKKLTQLLHEKELFSERGTNNEKGTGLGLAVCFEFAQKIDAKITVESEIKKGATFTIELPVHEEKSGVKEKTI